MRKRGLCWCGCGSRTAIPTYTDSSNDMVRGRPMRFVSGHNTRRPWPNWREKKNGGWLWKGSPGGNGYGKTWQDGRTLLAHRFVYEKLRGQIPKGLHIDHLCRRPMCVNPSHLEPVTAAVNKRRGIGMKLTTAQVSNMKRALRTCKRGDAWKLAKAYGISQTHLSHIRHGHRWADIQGG